MFNMEKTLYNDNNWASNSLFGGNSMYSTNGAALRHNSSYYGKPGATQFSKRTPRASLSRSKLNSQRSYRGSKSPVRTAIGGKRMSVESFGLRNSHNKSPAAGRSKTVDQGAQR